MEVCNGDGTCLYQCACECYDENTGQPLECTCGHRQHDGYCPSECCVPIECRNVAQCLEKAPQRYLNCHNGMCVNCAIQMGPHKLTTEVEECICCLENKTMLMLKCNHKICNECWYRITREGFGDEDDRTYRPLCSLCRNRNDWSKGR
jgi:hypothetical protein